MCMHCTVQCCARCSVVHGAVLCTVQCCARYSVVHGACALEPYTELYSGLCAIFIYEIRLMFIENTNSSIQSINVSNPVCLTDFACAS